MTRPRISAVALVLAMALLLPLVGATQPAAAQTPADGTAQAVSIEPALLDGDTIAHDAGTASLIVRLAGPSVVEARQAANDPSAPQGASPLSTAELAAHKALLERRQAAVREAITATGADIQADYQVALNGFRVRADRDEIAALARVPGVVSIARAPLLTLDLDDAVPHVGAQQIIDELGYDGSGTTVAVIDTGIDYTHADFGGSGDPVDHDDNDPRTVEDGTFPTEKVIGGYDFVGEIYSPACPVPQPPNVTCSPTPEPDDDPLDLQGHGTHVSGIVAGIGVDGTVAHGVAPGANLVGLKVFATPSGAPGSTDVAADAIEWATAVNMGLTDDLPGHHENIETIDVINMSLGSSFSSEMVEGSRIVGAAVEAGITVVASAGNSGLIAYVTGSPATSPMALSVASSYAPGEDAAGLRATWSTGGEQHELDEPAVEGVTDGPTAWLPPIADQPVEDAQLAWYGFACGDSEPAQDLTEKVALIERGTCPFTEKIINAQQEGAIAAVVFTDDRDVVTMACVASGPCDVEAEIPGVMIFREPGLQLKDLLEAGVEVTVDIYPDRGFPERADTISGFSSLGPSRFSGGIKPQITAPGSNIYSAFVGSGTEDIALSGTSMASPVVAGVAALLWDRNKNEGLELSAADIAALTMNYADPRIRYKNSTHGPLAPVSRQGAGVVQGYAAATGSTVVRSDEGLAELGFGHVEVTDDSVTIERTLSVRNMSDEDQSYAVSFEYAFPEEDQDQGVDVSFVPEQLTVPAGASSDIEVTLSVDPDGLREWDLRGLNQDGESAVTRVDDIAELEIDGYVHIDDTSSDGEGDRLVVPLHVIPRRRACVESTTSEDLMFTEEGETMQVTWENTCDMDGQIEVMPLMATDIAEDYVPDKLDIRHVGMRYGITQVNTGQGVEEQMLLEWQIHTSAARRIPVEGEFHIYFDTDTDGEFDYVAYNLYGAFTPFGIGGQWLVLLTETMPDDHLQPNLGNGFISGFIQNYDLDESTTTLQLNAEDLGLDLESGDETFGYAISAADGTEDFPLTEDFLGWDHAPNDLEDGGQFTFDQATYDCLDMTIQTQDGPADVNALNTFISVPGGSQAEIEVTNTCQVPSDAIQTGVLSVYAENVSTATTAELVGVDIGTPTYRTFMPYTANFHELVMPDEGTEPLEVTLDPVDDSGLSGTAVLTENDVGVEVQLDLEGTPEGGEHPAHIHVGTCAELGSIEYALEPVVEGSSTTVLEDLTIGTLLENEHAIAAHISADDLSVVTCGDISEPMEP